ncbi:E3 ubiquitin-protein ligase NRDP1-like protein [Leptotrombidium deliense]|uniref:E3 ubiquitin-protein ligase NRDP1-like protein n=1 Tax=Leptotrombidium deliense TaxID=299467 RepID=A0A443S815_9ACAR|nr:E3 ubiquitin-protein ligase NRDP1-like protein [Leptotrombidium deliense]
MSSRMDASTVTVVHAPLSGIALGYDRSRFVNLSDFADELSCPICLGIFREPVTTSCRHVFCKQCIKLWSLKSMTCPVDRKRIRKLHKPPVLLENILSKLRIRCEFEEFGCSKVVALNSFDEHLKCCDFKPKGTFKRLFHWIFK